LLCLLRLGLPTMVEKNAAPAEVRAYAPDAIDVRRILAAALIVAAILAGCAMAIAFLDRGFAHGYGREPPAPRLLQAPPVKGPALQPDPKSELEAYRASQQSLLHAYRWVDRPRGVVQIPIEQAMRLLVERNGVPGDAQ
jgi:hypothetical protein